MELNFDNFTIGQLRDMTREFLKQNPDFITAEEMLKKKKDGEKKAVQDDNLN